MKDRISLLIFSQDTGLLASMELEAKDITFVRFEVLTAATMENAIIIL
jgi:hypothetical protein